MKTTRWFPTLILGAVVTALAVGATAFLSTERVAAQVGDATGGLSWMPEGASIVGHMNLVALMNSPMREQWESELNKPGRMDELEEFRRATGIDPMRDIESVTFAAMSLEAGNTDGDAPQSRPSRWGFAVRGSFDRQRLVATMREGAELDEETYQGTTLYQRAEHATDDSKYSEDFSVAFATDDTVLVGDRAFLRQMLDSGFGRVASASPAIESAWGASSFDDATFWIAASPENGFGSMIPTGQQIPPIQSLALSGRLDADVALRARGRAADSESATKLADVVRGFIALGSLQQGPDPELGMILDSVTIDQFDNEVELSMSVPYETLERLSQRAKQAQAEPGS